MNMLAQVLNLFAVGALHCMNVIIDILMALVVIRILVRWLSCHLISTLDERLARPVVGELTATIQRGSRRLWGRPFTYQASLLALGVGLAGGKLVIGLLVTLFAV